MSLDVTLSKCTAAKVHLLSLQPKPMNSDLVHLFSSALSHGEYLWQVSLKSFQ